MALWLVDDRGIPRIQLAKASPTREAEMGEYTALNGSAVCRAWLCEAASAAYRQGWRGFRSPSCDSRLPARMTDWDVIVQFILHCDLSTSSGNPIINSTVLVLVTVVAATLRVSSLIRALRARFAREKSLPAIFSRLPARMTDWEVFVKTRVVERRNHKQPSFSPLLFRHFRRRRE